jgi:DegV family protein with EDD domain
MLARHSNLHIVPLTVSLGERQWPENELKSADMFNMACEMKLYPKTSQPAPGDFVKVFTPLIAANQQVIVITLASGLSGTVQSARTAAQMVADEHIHIIDSGTTAMGMIGMVEAMLAMAAKEWPIEVIVQKVREMVKVTHTVLVPNTLEYLYKGGRIGGAAALFGSIMQIRPVLHLVDGKIAVLDKVRTRQKAIVRMLEELKLQRKLAYIGIGYMDHEAEGLALQAQIREFNQHTPLIMSQLGPVLGAHLGPGTVGLIFQEQVSE